MGIHVIKEKLEYIRTLMIALLGLLLVTAFAIAQTNDLIYKTTLSLLFIVICWGVLNLRKKYDEYFKELEKLDEGDGFKKGKHPKVEETVKKEEKTTVNASQNDHTTKEKDEKPEIGQFIHDSSIRLIGPILVLVSILLFMVNQGQIEPPYIYGVNEIYKGLLATVFLFICTIAASMIKIFEWPKSLFKEGDNYSRLVTLWLIALYGLAWTALLFNVLYLWRVINLQAVV